MIKGRKFIYGVQDPRPIRNLPEASHYKLRLRRDAFAVCFVRGPRIMASFYIEEDPDSADWLLSDLIGLNQKGDRP